MAAKRVYKLSSKVVLWPGAQGAWHFAYVDKKHAAQIKKDFGVNARGFGSLRVRVTLGKAVWETSIFPDSRSGTYLLPLKASVRRTAGVHADDTVAYTITIL
jgi:hypothetical protein